MKTPREHLNNFQQASMDFWKAHAAINLLEGMNGAAANKTAQKCIRLLQQQQQRDLMLMDKAAELLGAPYPGKVPTMTSAKCQCGKFRPAAALSRGFRREDGKPAWFCDKCIPL